MFQGSQNQLKEVWEEADGLDPEDFDPKTFFNLHGKSLPTKVDGCIRCCLISFACRKSGICSSVYFPLFYNADTNGDGFFDEQELEALFTKEVKPSHMKLSTVSVNDICTDRL